MNPIVSIIMPLYNSASFVEQSILSVINQTFKHWEMIVIDDYSNDGGDLIAEKFVLENSKIFFLRNSINLGGAKTRNIAIEMALGRFIAFLDSDDIWLPSKLENQINYMLNENIGFSFSSYQTMNEKGMHLSIVNTPRRVSLKDMYSHNYIGCLTAVYDTNFYGKFYMPNIRKRQDYALWLVMLEKFDYAYSTNENLASYRVRKESLSSSKTDAVKFYFLILRRVANLSAPSSFYYTCKYILLTILKKKFPLFYSNFIIRR